MIFLTVLSDFVLIIVSNVTFLYPRSSPFFIQMQININDVDKSLNEVADDKIRKYRVDYNNNPPIVVSFIRRTVEGGICEYGQP